MSVQFYDGIPSFAMPFFLADFLEKNVKPGKPWVHVVATPQDAYTLQNLLSFWAPKVTTLVFPEWSVTPYDRLSPLKETMALRWAVRDFAKSDQKTLSAILTTPLGLIQRLPPYSVEIKNYTKG